MAKINRLLPGLVLLLWAAGLVWVSLQGHLIRQQKLIAGASLSLVALVLLGLWLAFLSPYSRRLRLGSLAALGLSLAALAGLFEIRGVSGDLVPILTFRFASRQPEPADLAAGAALAAAADYPQFLGPRRDGTLPGPALARDWRARPPRLVWKRPVGAGWAGFAVAGGAAFTLEQEGDHELVVSYELATGRLLWRHASPARYETVIAGIGPRTVPTVDGERVYALGATGQLLCLDRDSGSLLWQRDVLAENGAENLEWGKSCSPLVVDGKVVVSAGGPGGRSLVAYDSEDGELVWSGGEDRSSYSSPRLVELAGRRQIVIFNRGSLAGHDPEDGSVLWQYPWPARQPNVSTPLPLPGDRLFASSGYGVGSKLLELHAGADGLRPELLWESPRLKAKFTNVVAWQGHLYGLDDGIMVCLDPATGERCWKGGRYGHGQVILVGDLLLVQAEDGSVLLLEPNPRQLIELGRFQALSGKSWNPPALAGPYLLVRNDREAACYELPLAGG